jgi:hypothetical protein
VTIRYVLRMLAAVVVGCLVAGCGHDPGAATMARAAMPPSSAPSDGAGEAATAPIVPPAADVPASLPANQPLSGTADVAGSSASLAGVAHDADPDPALLKDRYALPGPITADTEPDGLRRIYGVANVEEGDVPGAEGETVRGVILFPNDPKRRAYVYFQDEVRLTGLSMVRVMDEGSRWHGVQGVHVGMPLAELARSNGGPFLFSGFDWDYGGQVTDWLGGKLGPARGGATLRVALAHGDQRRGVPASKLPIGDDSFRSDHPQLAKMRVTVSEISLAFPGLDDQ